MDNITQVQALQCRYLEQYFIRGVYMQRFKFLFLLMLMSLMSASCGNIIFGGSLNNGITPSGNVTNPPVSSSGFGGSVN